VPISSITKAYTYRRGTPTRWPLSSTVPGPK
jgi:hypothetical protein